LPPYACKSFGFSNSKSPLLKGIPSILLPSNALSLL